MTTKRFITIIFILASVSIIYIYDTTAAITSSSKCADYAMNLTVQSFPDSFIKTGNTFPSNSLKPESAQAAQANYELFYGFCMNKRGVAGL